MAIYENSRYTNCDIYEEEPDSNVYVLEGRERFTFDLTGAVRVMYTPTTRLDLLAAQYYNDKQLWWAILDANPKYTCELEINIGDVLSIPTSEEVMKWVIQKT